VFFLNFGKKNPKVAALFSQEKFLQKEKRKIKNPKMN
jgi:hypothetical protein